MTECMIERKVTTLVEAYRLLSRGDRVVVGVSGGADSVCLLHMLARSQRLPEVDLHVAHLDHQLRGSEAEADAEYVSRLAGSLGIPVTVGRQDVACYRREAKCSVEEAARELRYRFFVGVASDAGANAIAIGHTRDDQVETILMHILRGTGINGLCGLAPCSPLADVWQRAAPEAAPDDIRIVRPLLGVSRKETVDYCQEYQLGPRMDSSNLSPEFFRNRLRLHLLPVLRQYNPAVDRALLRLADLAREDCALIEQQVSGAWDEVVHHEEDAVLLDRERTANLAAALQRRLLRAAVVHLVGDTRDIEASHVEAARSLLSKVVSKKVFLPHGLVCYGEYDHLVIGRMRGSGDRAEPYTHSTACPLPELQNRAALAVPGETVLPGWEVKASIVRRSSGSASLQDSLGPGKGEFPDRLVAEFDLERAGREVCVRKRMPGDRFHPLGMDTSKKLQDFMVDARIPRPWRDRVPIVCSADQIIWVVGWRIDGRVQVTDESLEILRLEFVRRQ